MTKNIYKALNSKRRGQKMKDVRTYLGLSQTGIADSIGISQAAWARAEGGLCNLKASNLKIVTEKYNINIRYITHGEPDMFEEEKTESGAIGIRERKLNEKLIQALERENQTLRATTEKLGSYIEKQGEMLQEMKELKEIIKKLQNK